MKIVWNVRPILKDDGMLYCNFALLKDGEATGQPRNYWVAGADKAPGTTAEELVAALIDNAVNGREISPWRVA